MDNWQLAELLGLYHRYREDYWTPPPPSKPENCRIYAFHRRWNGFVDVRGYSFFLKDFEIGPCGSVPRYLKPDTCWGLRKTDSLLFRTRDNTALLTLEGQTFSIPLEKAMAWLEEGFPDTDNCDGGYSSKPFPADSVLILEGNNGHMKVAMQVVDMAWEKVSSYRRLMSLRFDLLLGYK
jgi:hypothetical protein